MEPLPSYSNFQNGWEASRVVFVSMLGYGPRGEVWLVEYPAGSSKYYAAKCIDMGALGPDDIHVLRRACELTRQVCYSALYRSASPGRALSPSPSLLRHLSGGHGDVLGAGHCRSTGDSTWCT
eukprot:Sspe_Gene.100722::Locus_75386_Transcript_2_4_Confidence_0.667_Length_441::g.100722::m.100722